MFRGFYNLTSGMLSQGRRLDVVSNNITNISTAGYKADHYTDSTFQEVMLRRAGNKDKSRSQKIGEQGYIRASRWKKEKPAAVSAPLSFTTEDGFTVLVGRNNRQNDRLTMKLANNNDIWFHTKNIPGSHTVLVTEGRAPTPQAMEKAAKLAAEHSKAKDSAQVPVDYTQVRHVSKPQEAQPGMVIYINYKTVFVAPQE